MADDLMQKWERSKLRWEQSGTAQSGEFWQWVKQMKGHEIATRKNERVYLVISKLRRVAEGERRKVGSGGLGALRDRIPSSSMQSSKSVRSVQSLSKQKDPSRHDLGRPESDDSRDDLSSSSDDADESVDVRKQLKSALTVGAKMLVSALSTNNSEASDMDTDTSTSSLKRKRRSLDRGRDEKRQRYVPRYPSPAGILPNLAFYRPSQRRSAELGERDDLPRSGVDISSQSRRRSASSPRVDSPLLDDHLPARPATKKPTKPNPPPQSHFQGSKTAEQHWAVEVGGRYFELQVCKKLYGDGVKSFSQFTCLHRVGQKDREITEKIYVGRTHMTHRVLREIGVGIMKTQPKYTLPSDNCQHFMAVYLPRILCERHPHLTTLPNTNVEWVFKFTTLPTYSVGILEGLVTEVEHRYIRIASGVHKFLDHMKSKEAAAKRTFESIETSKYHFTLQGNDRRPYESCRTVRKNPYLIIHREYSKSERRPLGDSEERANYFWLWEVNRKVRKTAQLQELEMEQNIEAAKGIWKGFRKRKMDIEHEARLRMKWEQDKDHRSSTASEERKQRA